jgi:hypothetical protein
MTDVLEQQLIGVTPERAKTAIETIGENTLEDIRRQSLPERSNPDFQKLYAALDEMYLDALAHDKAQIRVVCLFLYLEVRKRYAQAGLR